jgi:hypothetical protein
MQIPLGHGYLFRWPFYFPERRWMMLIIEIHVDTIENTETSPSTRIKREDERPTRASQKSRTTGNRFWKAIKLSIPGSLIPQNRNER